MSIIYTTCLREDIEMEQKYNGFDESLWCLKRDPKDNLNLTETFNNYMRDLYCSLLMFSNKTIIDQIYKDLHAYGVIVLRESIGKNIDQKKFRDILSLEIEFCLNKMQNDETIDFFSEDWAFSKLKLNDMQRDILDATIGAIIARSDSELARRSKINRMCKRYNISKLRYNFETAKLSKMIVGLIYENDLGSKKLIKLGK